jgi:hypothetical protein
LERDPEAFFLIFGGLLQGTETVKVELDVLITEFDEFFHVFEGEVEFFEVNVALDSGEEGVAIFVDTGRVTESLDCVFVGADGEEEFSGNEMDAVVHGFLADVSLQVLEGFFLLSENQVALGPVQVHLKNLLFLVERVLELSVKLVFLFFLFQHCVFVGLLVVFFLEFLGNAHHVVQIRVTFLVLFLHGVDHGPEIKMFQDVHI